MSTTDTAIAATLASLRELLQAALARAGEAQGYMGQGDRNAAIGTVMDLDRLLADAAALHRAALTLHRRA